MYFQFGPLVCTCWVCFVGKFCLDSACYEDPRNRKGGYQGVAGYIMTGGGSPTCKCCRSIWRDGGCTISIGCVQINV
ncbi:hypothetical protein BD309DRAFT_615171 [Dichomitus squalens]|nr:hypothetical protein BD309DRAFT_615171 [Dichomitus squalens]